MSGKKFGPGKKFQAEQPVNLPEWFYKCKERKIITFDTKRFPFRELVADWLGVSSDLETIHLLPLAESETPLHPKVTAAWKEAAMPRLSKKARRSDTVTLQRFFQCPQYKRLMRTYRLFLKEVIAQQCTSESKYENIVYQCPPTTRVVLPNGRPTISLHSDKEYRGHQAAEINCWLPLTAVFDTKSLWLESEPNKGDFQAVSMKYGECLIFDGFDCRHYTVKNTTDSCRVSLDFRIIPSELCIQRKHCGDFCVEETTRNGYKAYPHNFWSINRGIKVAGGKKDAEALLFTDEDELIVP